MNAFSGRAVVPVLFGLLCVASVSRADGPDTTKHDPAARERLAEVARAYKGLNAYEDHGSFVMAMKHDGQAIRQTMTMPVKFVRPNKLVVDTDQVRLHCDGTLLTTSVVPLKKYSVAQAPKLPRLETFRDNAMGAILFSSPSGLPMSVLLNLLFREDAVPVLLEGSAGLKAEPDREIDGGPAQAVLIEQSRGPDLRLLIDPKTKLLKGIELVVREQGREEAKSQSQVTDLSFTWTSGAVSTEPPAEKAFVFEPPAGFTRVADLSSLREAGAERKDPLTELVGNAAPDFTLTVLDGPGKTKTITKDDLAGKVVVIDFWATWCGPCMAELPEVQKLVEAYAKQQAKDLVVVALSQDSEAGDLESVRKLVETTLDKKKLTLAEGPISMVALDPAKTIGKAFHVEGIPTVVILDAKGVVQAVHVGFRPDVRETLTDAIDTLRAGRSLVEAKPQDGGRPGPNRAKR
jgi:thiol-disulfide isomerase/thioredoxin